MQTTVMEMLAEVIEMQEEVMEVQVKKNKRKSKRPAAASDAQHYFQLLFAAASGTTGWPFGLVTPHNTHAQGLTRPCTTQFTRLSCRPEQCKA